MIEGQSDENFQSGNYIANCYVAKHCFSTHKIMSHTMMTDITSFVGRSAVFTDVATTTLTVNQIDQTYKDYDIYVNTLGDDSNSGTIDSPVATIQRGIDLLNDITGHVATIHLSGAFTADELDFCRADKNFCEIIVEGTKSSEVSSIVDSVGTHGPFNSWYSITTLDTLGAYAKSFIYNKTKSRYYVIESNTANLVNTIVGKDYDIISNGGVPWEVGDEFSIYTLDLNSSIVCNKIITNSKIVFRNLHFLDAVACPENTFAVRFQACRLDCGTPYSGNIEIEGVYSLGIKFHNGYTKIRNESWWLDASIEFYTDAHLVYCKNTATINCSGGNFVGYGILGSESNINFSSCMCHLKNCTFQKTTTPAVMSFLSSTMGAFENLTVIGGTICIDIVDNLIISFIGDITITGITAVRTNTGIVQFNNVNLNVNCTGIPFIFEPGSKITFAPISSNITSSTFVIDARGSEINLLDGIYNWTAPTIISLRKNSTCRALTPVISTIQVGVQPAGPFIQQSDYALGGSEYCLLVIG